MIGMIPGILPLILVIILGIITTVLSFKKSRRYIGIGVISAVIIPFLFFGACVLFFLSAM